MMIETADGNYISSDLVKQMEPHPECTALLDAGGDVLGYAKASAPRLADAMAPIFPAEPGYEIAYLIRDVNGRPESCGSDPIIGWRIMPWPEPPVPITVRMKFGRAPSAIFKDGKEMDGWMTIFHWFHGRQRQYDEAHAKAKTEPQASAERKLHIVQTRGNLISADKSRHAGRELKELQ